VEDGDLEVRASPFSWLDEPDRGARFPTTLRSLPLVVSGEMHLGQLDWKLTQEGRGPLPKEDFEKAMAATPLTMCQANAQAIEASLTELNALTESLGTRMGGMSPGLGGMRESLESCRVIVRKLLQMKGADESGAPGVAGEASPAGDGVLAAGGGVAVRAGLMTTAVSRGDAYRQLAQAADLLQQLEPHSPIPYLVRKAVELGGLPFPELMRRLIRDGNVLTELNRELGIREEEAPPPSE